MVEYKKTDTLRLFFKSFKTKFGKTLRKQLLLVWSHVYNSYDVFTICIQMENNVSVRIQFRFLSLRIV